MILHLLENVGLGSIYVAGFDSIFGSESHFDKSMNLFYSKTMSTIETVKGLLKRFVGRDIFILEGANGFVKLDVLIENNFSGQTV